MTRKMFVCFFGFCFVRLSLGVRAFVFCVDLDSKLVGRTESHSVYK